MLSQNLSSAWGDAPHRSRVGMPLVRIDAPLLLLLLILMTIGLVTLYSASGGSQGLVVRQAAHFGVGLVLMLPGAKAFKR